MLSLEWISIEISSWWDIQTLERIHNNIVVLNYFFEEFLLVPIQSKFIISSQSEGRSECLCPCHEMSDISVVLWMPRQLESDYFNSWFLCWHAGSPSESQGRDGSDSAGPAVRRAGPGRVGWTGHWKTPFVWLTQLWPPSLWRVTRRGLKWPDYPG